MKRLFIALAGILALSTGVASAAQLLHSKFTIASVLSVDTATHAATFRLHKGSVEGKTVWFIVTDASSVVAAKKLGVNYAPSLANLGAAAIEKAKLNDDATFTFTGGPSFAATRTYVPGAGGFPPSSATPGGTSDATYSPFVRLTNSMPGVVLNAPVVATGNGPFDVTTHANTEDRVVAIDTKKMTVTLVLARGFFNGKPIYYLSTEASNPVASSVERATYVPLLAKASPSAEIPIGVVADGPQTGSPQGLAFLALRTPLGVDATAANASTIMSSFNVLSLAPDLKHPYAENGYTPLWNVMVVGAKQAKRLTSYSQIAPLAKAAGFVVNCPVVAYGDDSGY
ncbi:MAG TPA: hypothetical protein VNF68_07570 [Candidatus Baltobacteraceae bacterium]|nr:hypothetical protein [Candidatus Baltobacteraceae bacterium]